MEPLQEGLFERDDDPTEDTRARKSVCLLWLLMRRLALGLPAGLQTREDYAILTKAAFSNSTI